MKTNSSEGKVFINICHSPSIPPPVDVTEDELLQMLEEDQAGFRIPMSLGEPHAELDASQWPWKTPSLLPSPNTAFLRSSQSALGARGVQCEWSRIGGRVHAPGSSQRVMWRNTCLI